MPYKDRGKWRAIVKIDGIRTSQAFPPTKEGWRQAVQWETEEKKRREKEAASPLINTGFVRYYEEYLEWCTRRYTRNTLVEKTTLGKRFLEYLGLDPTVESITPKQFQDFLLHSASERSNNRANRDRKNLLAFFNWLRKIHGAGSNPVVDMDKLPHHRKSQYVPMESDILKLLAACTRRERAFLNCYLQTSARRSSVFGWKWREDIDFNLRQVRIGCAKNNDGSMEYIWLPMTQELHDDLQWWYRNRDHRDSEHVWTVPEGPYAGQPYTFRHKFLRGLCNKAEIPVMGFHALRRYAATKLAKYGVAMKAIQRILGHKNLATTERYLGRTNEDLRQTMELLGNHSTTDEYHKNKMAQE